MQTRGFMCGGTQVRLAKEYNELALAKYHVENAEQYKQYGAELYQVC